ncbi:MAG: hypothetical protein AAF243_09660 [Cyanobacteria bacterium P01_A01_bin.137]
MKNLAESCKQSIVRGMNNIVIPADSAPTAAIALPSGMICNEGAHGISYRFPNDIGFQEKFDLGAQITRNHPKGKALTVFDTDGSTWYSLTVEQSIY